jgi:hypothetical protein
METEDFIDFYFSELLSWLDNRTEPIGSPIYTKRDYFRRYDIFPPDPDERKKPYTEFWPVINTWDLKIEKKKAMDRTYQKSPSHHVFLITMLELVKDYPEDLIEMYAREKGLTKILDSDPIDGEVKCLELLINDLKIYLENKRRQLIPLLYHGHPGGIFMSADLEVVAKGPKPDPEAMYEFGFSKESSDAFTTVLINQLTERLEFVKRMAQPSSEKANQPEVKRAEPFVEGQALRSFEDLFYDPEWPGMIINTLKKFNIVDKNGNWVGLTERSTEILALIDVLVEKRYIRKHKQTEMGRIFCKKFGIDLKDRTLRNKPKSYYENFDEYQRIIPDLK